MYPNEIIEAIQAIEKKLGNSVAISEIHGACSPRERSIRIYIDNDKPFDYYSWNIEKKTLDFFPFK